VQAFGGLKVVDGVDLQARRGGARALIGPNGSCKTTMVNVVTGLYRATTGEVFVDGVDVTTLPPHKQHCCRPRAHVPEHSAVPVDDGYRKRRRRRGRDGNALIERGRDALWGRARAALDFVGLDIAPTRRSPASAMAINA
jgi:branched-chain amino acid transport system permease protein